MKKTIEIKREQIDLSGKLSDVIETLQTIDREFFNCDAFIEDTGCYDEQWLELVVTRKETDEEYLARLNKEKEEKERKAKKIQDKINQLTKELENL